jgi:hypothetical protein
VEQEHLAKVTLVVMVLILIVLITRAVVAELVLLVVMAVLMAETAVLEYSGLQVLESITQAAVELVTV